MFFLTTNIPALQILCFNIKYLSGEVCLLSEDHVSLTALLRWPKKWLIMTCDSDTYSGSPFPFFSLPVRQREAKGMFREGGGACSVYFFTIYFKRLMTQPRTFLAQWDPSRAQGPCFVYFSAAGKGREEGGCW